MPEVTWMRWMSKRPHCESLRVLVAGWLLLGFVLGGCSTVVSRIDQHAELFASLDKETQNTLLGGEAKLGYTTAMTYIAYGPPNETRHKTTQDGESVVWVYQYSYPLYHRHHHLFDPYDDYHHDYYYYHPNYYEIRDYRLITFVDGRITSIEEIE